MCGKDGLSDIATAMASMAESFKSYKQYSPGGVDMIGFQAKSWAATLEEVLSYSEKESRRLCRLITKIPWESAVMIWLSAFVDQLCDLLLQQSDGLKLNLNELLII